MNTPTNTFKERLSAGETLYGLWLGVPDTSVAEICALAGFDWLLIDGEHGPFDLRSIQAHLQAMSAYPVSAIARPPSGETAGIKQYLDLGVQTLVIPMVESAAQAEQLVRDVRYPPAGARGLGTSLARAARWNHVSDYLESANREVCLVVQVESVAGLENLDEILAIDDGIDGVFLGPSDLSASMGLLGKPGHPDVVARITDALSRARAAGKAAGVLCMDPELASEFEHAGANFIGVGVDTQILARGAKELAARFKSP